MQVHDIVLDVLGELFGGKINRHKIENSKELKFEKYANNSLSTRQFKIYYKVNINEHNTSRNCYYSIKYHYLNYQKESKDEKHLFKKNESTLNLVLSSKSNGFNECYLLNDLFDSKYHYDFTNVNDKGKKFMRGGLEYKRPCGWKRYALKVIDKYENNKWLGCSGNSNSNTEWAVSYHGTKNYCVEPIVKKGLKPGNRNIYGIGIYCTPDINTAEKYAEVFTSPKTNKKYKIVFQNRVKPSSIIKCKSKGGPDDYWYIEDGKDIRPYGICIKEIK